MTALLVAYVVVAFICMVVVTLSEFIKHGTYPEEMEELYTVVGFGFLWPVSIAWELYCEWKHPPPVIGRLTEEDLDRAVNGSVIHTKCIHCGDVRVIYSDFKSATKGYLSPRWWQFCDGIQAECSTCPYCGKELPPDGL